MKGIEIARDDLPDGGQLITIGRDNPRATAAPFLTHVVGGKFDGDRWRSPTREWALECHAHTLRIYSAPSEGGKA